MSKEVEQEFVERYDPIDDIKSSHSEFQRSTEYSNEELYDLDKLRSIAEEWGEESYNPIRSSRSQDVCRIIALRATFECAAILGNIELMTECYTAMNEQVLAA